jgi:hypothetical protein
MAANIQIYRLTGTGPASSASETQITSTTNRAGTQDNASPGTDYPIKIPDAGAANPKYSYWVTSCIGVPAGNGGYWTELSAVKWYTDGTSFGYAISGIVGYAGYNDGYDQATGTEKDTGDYMGTGHASISGLNTNMFSFTSGSVLSGTTGVELGRSSTGRITSGVHTRSSLIVYQLAVYPEATAGSTGAPTITWQYDEI